MLQRADQRSFSWCSRDPFRSPAGVETSQCPQRTLPELPGCGRATYPAPHSGVHRGCAAEIGPKEKVAKSGQVEIRTCAREGWANLAVAPFGEVGRVT